MRSRSGWLVFVAAVVTGCASPEARLFQEASLQAHWKPGPDQKYTSEVRVAPDLARPPQVALQTGFWNSTAKVAVKGKDYTMIANVSSAWNEGRTSTWRDPKPSRADINELGFWRLKPQYFASPSDQLLTRKTLGGRWTRFQPLTFEAPAGSRVIKRITRRIQVPLVYGNPAGGGGGAIVKIENPNSDWKLADIGIQRGVYSIFMKMDDPLAVYEKKPAKREDLETLSMHPIVLAEETVYTLLDSKTNKIYQICRPTGWIVGTGVYTDNRKD